MVNFGDISIVTNINWLMLYSTVLFIYVDCSPKYNVNFFKQFTLIMNALDNKGRQTAGINTGWVWYGCGRLVIVDMYWMGIVGSSGLLWVGVACGNGFHWMGVACSNGWAWHVVMDLAGWAWHAAMDLTG